MKLSNAIDRRDTQRTGRRQRVRVSVRGTAARPRLSVFRSNRFMYVQLIDDQSGRTLVAASSRDADVGSGGKVAKNVDVAAALGKKLATAALAKGIAEAVFDKSWYRYHGRVRALADAARAAGLKF